MIELRHEDRVFSAVAEGEGPVVLCVHGFPDHSRSFRHQLPALAEAGVQAVAPMLRGYEPSSQGRRHISDFHPLQVAGDLVAWARELGGGEPVHLVGHDWGAVATYLACALEPALFRSATTIAIPPLGAMQEGIRRHPIQLRNSSYMLFFQLRGLADRIVQRRDFAFLEVLWRRWSPGWAWDPDDMLALKRSFREPGVVWSALAYYRAMLNPFLADSQETRRLGELPNRVPTLAITGELDGCMDTRLHDYADPSEFPNGYRMERIAGAGHFVHQEKPDELNRILLEWISQH
ncbi:MAG: alpha/beta hydrolase [bacterium]|nr:alpha/beta hydrolase [bacterium]MCP5067875.1 alpha/beta hydrolase [bacterium]